MAVTVPAISMVTAINLLRRPRFFHNGSYCPVLMPAVAGIICITMALDHAAFWG